MESTTLRVAANPSGPNGQPRIHVEGSTTEEGKVLCPGCGKKVGQIDEEGSPEFYCRSCQYDVVISEQARERLRALNKALDILHTLCI